MRTRLAAFLFPMLASVTLVMVAASSVFVVFSAIADRDRLHEQSRDLEALLEAEQRSVEVRQQQLDRAVEQASDLLHQILAEHDKRTGESHEQLYQRISALLSRPAGVSRDPVTAVIPRSSTATAPRITTAPAPRTTTTCPKAGKSGRCK